MNPSATIASAACGSCLTYQDGRSMHRLCISISDIRSAEKLCIFHNPLVYTVTSVIFGTNRETFVYRRTIQWFPSGFRFTEATVVQREGSTTLPRRTRTGSCTWSITKRLRIAHLLCHYCSLQFHSIKIRGDNDPDTGGFRTECNQREVSGPRPAGHLAAHPRFQDLVRALVSQK